MPIPTTRAKENALIIIDEKKCNGCGHCVSACSDDSLILFNKKVVVNNNPFFGCIACGHCMAVCPENAIQIIGRTLSPDDLFEMPSVDRKANYDQIMAIYQRRRSIRHFKDKPVEDETIEKIIEAAKTAPMGLPPSDVHLLILKGKEQTHAFAKDFCNYLDQMKWFVSPWFLNLMPLLGKSQRRNVQGLYKTFVQSIHRTNYRGEEYGQLRPAIVDLFLRIALYRSRRSDYCCHIRHDCCRIVGAGNHHVRSSSSFNPKWEESPIV
jgi:ferredoxin